MNDVDITIEGEEFQALDIFSDLDEEEDSDYEL